MKKTAEQKELDRIDRDTMWNLFLEIWSERQHFSAVSGRWLGREPLTTMFDHLLEKAQYPQFKLVKTNIILVTPEEHAAKTNGFPLPRHQELIEQAKQNLLYAE